MGNTMRSFNSGIHILTLSSSRWRHQMEAFPRYWPFVRGIHRSPVKSPVNSPHKSQWRGTLMFSLICVRLNKRLSKQSWGWWFETLSRPLWRHCNVCLLLSQANFTDLGLDSELVYHNLSHQNQVLSFRGTGGCGGKRVKDPFTLGYSRTLRR